MIRWLRRLALAVGFPLVLGATFGTCFVTLRLVQARWFHAPVASERTEQKQAYLDALPTVDPSRAPSIVVVFFDDLGWGDLSVQGNPLIHTPRIDRAAAEGLRFTHFYSASPVCSPSRASLLTGRYPPRAGVGTHVFFPRESGLGLLRLAFGLANELPRDEILLPEILNAAGYATGMVGKWHLGGEPGHRPMDFGFDRYLGVLWSNDMWPLHLYEGDEILESDMRGAGSFFGEHDEEDAPAGGIDQSRLTARYTEAAVAFIAEHRDEPFFLYVAHTSPHVPHYPSREFAGRSEGGVYGDVVEDLDRSTGAILDALEEHGVADDTLVFITSDNGADYAGSPGALRGRKGQTHEGGQRVPMIVRWPGRIAAGGTTDAMAMNIDLLPTVLGELGLPLPEDREIDGRDLGPLLAAGGRGESPHRELFYFPQYGALPEAVRDERFKYRLDTGERFRRRAHLARMDAGFEAHDLRHKHPKTAARLAAALEAKRAEFDANPRGWR